MYIGAFWSFTDADSTTMTIRNEMDGTTVACSPLELDVLLAARDGAIDGEKLGGPLRSALSAAHILFDDLVAAERWYREIEASAFREFPRVDQIELTNRCPYTCKMCPRTSSMTRGLGDMSVDLFEKIIAQIAPHQSYVALHHFGESLVHKDLPNMIRLANGYGVSTGLSCNPPSLKHQIADRILDAGIGSLLLSLDSLDAATYKSIRGPAADINKAKDNIRYLVQQRDAGGHATTITLQLIRMGENAQEAEDFLEFCREVGVDRGVVVRLGRWDFSDEKTAGLGTFETPLHRRYCQLPSDSVVILWDGRVVPCCHDYDGQEVIGTAVNSSLRAIWNSPAAQQFRDKANETALCGACAFSRKFREERRKTADPFQFHRRVRPDAVMEYVAPTQIGRDARKHFDGFDLVGR
jgi:radical SAM protein with 4Fe4S-binding SPASM domain